MQRLSFCIPFLISGMFLLLLSPAARADSVTYTYTGPQFTIFTGDYSCPGICSISATFTLSQALAPNLFGTDISAQVLSMSITDGVHADTNVADLVSAVFFTDSQGNITGWSWEDVEPQDGFADVFVMDTVGNFFSFGSFDRGASGNSNTGIILGTAEVDNNPGAWTSSANQAVPEPSSFLMLTASMLAVAAATRRRRAGRACRA